MVMTVTSPTDIFAHATSRILADDAPRRAGSWATGEAVPRRHINAKLVRVSDDGRLCLVEALRLESGVADDENIYDKVKKYMLPADHVPCQVR